MQCIKVRFFGHNRYGGDVCVADFFKRSIEHLVFIFFNSRVYRGFHFQFHTAKILDFWQ